MPELLFIQKPARVSDLLNGLDEKSISAVCKANYTYPEAQVTPGSIFTLGDDLVSRNISFQLNHLPLAQKQCIKGGLRSVAMKPWHWRLFLIAISMTIISIN